MSGHRLGSRGKDHAGDGGEQLRRHAHGQRQGELQRLDDVPVKEDVDCKDNRHENQHDLDEQLAEMTQATFKARFRRTMFQPL